MKKRNRMTKPQTNFAVRIGENSLTASSAQEALRLAGIAIGKQISTNHLSDEDCVKVLWHMAKGSANGVKLIHSFSLPWNLKFHPSTMTLQSKEVENGDKPNEVGTGRISKKTADAISPSVLNNHTAQIDSLTESMKEVNAAFKSQLALNQAFESRLTALEKAVKALQDAQKPLPVVTTKPKADKLQEVIDLVNSGEATIAPKKESKPKASKKPKVSDLQSTMALLFS
jgi:hypothetical protein